MYSLDEKVINALLSGDAETSCNIKVLIDKTIWAKLDDSDIIKWSIDSDIASDGTYSIGNACTHIASFELVKDKLPIGFTELRLIVSVNVSYDGTTATIPMGTFIATPANVKYDATKISITECMDYLSTLNSDTIETMYDAYRAKHPDFDIYHTSNMGQLRINTLLNVISETTGFSVVDNGENHDEWLDLVYYIRSDALGGEGASVMHELSNYALLGGRNFYISRDAKSIVFTTIGKDDVISLNSDTYLTFEPSVYGSCGYNQVTFENAYVWGEHNSTSSSLDDENGMHSENFSSTVSCEADVKSTLTISDFDREYHHDTMQENVDFVAKNISNIAYRCYSADVCGLPFVDCGDLISISDYDGNVYKNCLIAKHTITYDGGLYSNISCNISDNGESSTTMSNRGGITSQINTVSANVSNVKKVVTEEIESNKAKFASLEAENASVTGRLDANEANIKQLSSDKANIKDLEATTARVGTLESNNVTINDTLNANSADIATLKSGKADITDLTAINGEIDDLKSNNIDTDNLTANISKIKLADIGGAFAESIQTKSETSAKSVIDVAYIKDVIANNVTVADLLAKVAQAETFALITEDGKTAIGFNGATQQFYDKNGKVRVQIGQDAKGNFNFIVLGEDGTTALFDSTGIKKDAISDGLIVNDMLAKGTIDKDRLSFDVIEANEQGGVDISKIYDGKGGLWGAEYDSFKSTTEQGISDVGLKIDNLQIGGRNLVLNSTFKNKLTSWLVQNISCTCGTDGSYDYVCFSATSPSSMDYRLYSLLNNDLGHEQGVQYTLSFYAKASATVEIHGGHVKALTKFSITTEWQKYVTTYTVPDTGSLTFYIDGANVKLYLSKVKLEKGNKATDWSPAPEDIDAQIQAVTDVVSGVSSKVDKNTKSITDKVWQTEIDKSIGDENIQGIRDRVTQTEKDITGIKTTVSDQGSNLKNNYYNKSEVDQKADKINWVVESGTSKSDMTLTDRAYKVIADNIDLTGKVTFSSLDSGTQSKITSALDTANTLNKIASKSYAFTGASGAGPRWVKLGTLKTAGDSRNTSITVYTGDGYNGNSRQNSKLEIVIKDARQSSESASKACGVSVTRQNCEGVTVQVRSSSSTKCDVWVYFPWGFWDGTYTVSGMYESWTHSGIKSTTEPTDGTAQDVAYRLNAENALSSANSYSKNAVDWVNSNGADQTALLSMVKKWTDNAVSDTTQINGGWIKTNTLTANKIAVGDFTNLITVNPMIEDSYTGIPYCTLSTGIDNKNNLCLKNNATDDVLMLCNFTPFVFQQGDEIYFKGTVPNYSSTTFNATITIWLYNSSKQYKTEFSSSPFSLNAHAWNSVETSITLPAYSDYKNIFYYLIGIRKPHANKSCQIGLAQGAVCRKKTSGKMIVDGTIDAKAINCTDLSALGATIGGWKVTETDVYYDNSDTSAGMGTSSSIFWAGSTFENRGGAPFRVRSDGSFIATDATIRGTLKSNTGITLGELPELIFAKYASSAGTGTIHNPSPDPCDHKKFFYGTANQRPCRYLLVCVTNANQNRILANVLIPVEALQYTSVTYPINCTYNAYNTLANVSVYQTTSGNVYFLKYSITAYTGIRIYAIT